MLERKIYYLRNNRTVNKSALRTNIMQFLADAANHGKVLREIGCDNAGDAVGVQVLELAGGVLAIKALLGEK